ncbi:MAG: SpaH/EbpB family LPXTG-anchored major pilin [Streptococcaceae bacterium]|jgi:fimbrial isopeptide formation D2 family protein/LPXTG-motif cell wall-anchored protein|nr:SpaH/EbpB family LPXTG-anchored major pilin [Streptococcaceae bacterium]
MKKKSLLQAVIAVLTLLAVFVVPVKAVFAADDITTENVNVTINKRIWDEGKTPSDIQNTGETMDFGGDPLNGSEFTVYNVTEKYYELIQNSDQKTAIAAIQADAEAVAPAYATKVAAQVTAGQGQATFGNLPVKNDAGQYNVYLFIETKTPDNITVTKRSVPIVLAMPIYKLDANQNPTDVINSDIQLYPKNETAEDTKEFSNAGDFSNVTIDGQEFANVTTGDTLNYKLTVNIPANIGDANAVQSFKVHDKPSDGLALVDGTVKVGDLVEGTDYTIIYANGGFTVELNLTSDKVKALAGQKLQLTYDMKLTAEVDPDQLQNNKASVQINNTPEQEITPPKPVGTGGYQFVKKDAQTGKTLKGAEFVVANSDQSKFAVFTTNANNEYVFSKWVDTKDAATKVVSDDNGSIKVIGLVNGSYVLNETKTPSDDYVILKDGTIEFTVEHGKYATSELEVKNTPKGLLPSTGGSGIYAFLIIGAGMMVGAYIWFKKSREQAEV